MKRQADEAVDAQLVSVGAGEHVTARRCSAVWKYPDQGLGEPAALDRIGGLDRGGSVPG
jgi:hypothetical protein